MDNLSLTGRDLVRKQDIEPYYHVSLSSRLLGKWQAIALQNLDRARLDHMRTVDLNFLPVQSWNLYVGATERLSQWYLVSVLDVGVLSVEERMRFVANNKGDVCRYFARDTVAFLTKRHLRSRLPARFNINLQDFLFNHSTAIFFEVLFGNFHLLLAAGVDFLQANEDVSLNCRVLKSLLSLPIQTTHALRVADPAQDVVEVSVHVFLPTAGSGLEKRLKWIGRSEEL